MIFMAAAAVPPSGMSLTSILVAVAIAAITSSALAAGLTGFINRRKITSEAENIQAQTSDLVWKRVKGELETMQATITALRKSDTELRRDVTTQGRLIVDVTRKLDIGVAYIERLLDLWPKGAPPPPPIPAELADKLSRSLLEDFRLPTTQTATPDEETEQP